MAESEPMRVLIAEDSGPSRLALERTLSKWGYQVVSCPDGARAWEELQKDDAPQLAILDWMMPGYHGPDICRMVRRRGQEPYTYILLLTSRSQKEDLVEGMESGADDYLIKPFDQAELNVRLRAGIRVLTLQAELVSAREQLRDLAMRDSLTGIWNRRSIVESLEREAMRAEREKTPVGVIMLDLDHFKRVNDTHGHQAGDAVLQEASRRLMSSVRPYDGVGRYGGEEFMIVLPGCDETTVTSRAEAMRAAIGNTPVRVGELIIPITGSLGCTVMRSAKRDLIPEVVRSADEALYEAKHAGRNCVRFQAFHATSSAAADKPHSEPADFRWATSK